MCLVLCFSVAVHVYMCLCSCLSVCVSMDVFVYLLQPVRVCACACAYVCTHLCGVAEDADHEQGPHHDQHRTHQKHKDGQQNGPYGQLHRERDRQTEPRRHVDSTISTFLCVHVYMRVPMFECAYGGAARTRRQSAQPTGLSVSLSISYLSQAINTCERGLAYVRACVRAVCARRRTLSLSLSLSFS
jgi:hypothetical protein